MPWHLGLRKAADTAIERGRLATAPLVVGIALVAAVLVGGIFYLGYVEDSLWQSTVDEVLEITDQSAHAFEVYLDKDIKKLDILVSAIEPCDSDDVAGIIGHCAYFNKAQNFYGVVNLDTGYLYTGTEDAGVRLPDDVVERYRSFPERGVREPYVGDYTGLTMIGYYQRINFADGVPALVYEGAPVSTLSQEFTLSFFEDQGFSYIVNAAGDVLVRPATRHSDDVQDNVLAAVRNGDNDEASVDALVQGLAHSRGGVVRLSLDGRECVVAFVPVELTDGWSMVSVIPDAVIMEQGNKVIGTSAAALVLVALCVAVVVVYALATVRFRRTVRAQGAETRYREELFSALASSTDEIFLMMRTDPLSVEYVSPNVGPILGIAPEEVASDLSVLDLDGADPLGLGELSRGETVVREGARHNRATGEERWFHDSVYYAEVDGSVRVMAVLSDRTRERRDEEVLREALSVAEAANESKSAFLSNVSHDIRTPMNAIVGLAALLERDAASPERVREHGAKIRASSRHMLELLNDVLDMSKIESGKTTLTLSEFALSDLAEEVVAVVRPQAQAKGQDFRVGVAGVHDEVVVGDRLRIARVLVNILTNAVNYTGEGGSVDFEIRQVPNPRKSFAALRFTVADTGVGMAPEFLETLFEPFTREVSSLTNTVQGTGLGLAITKSLVDLMGGAITVESELGRGSTFVVDLELRCAAQRDLHAFFREAGLARALVVDGDRGTCREVACALDSAGVASHCVTDEDAAVAAASAAERAGAGFDLVIVDGELPGAGGIACAAAVRAVVGERVPVMVLTASDRIEAEEACRTAGLDGVLQKPFFLSSLVSLIEEVRSRAADAPGPGRPAGLAGRHLLAAEDNALSAEILAELLAMEGATVEVVGDGAAAVAAFEAAPAGTFDAVLMDVQMPVMDGYAATRAIRAGSHPDAATVPIVAMTANAFMDDVRDAREAGMDVHMAKPVDIAELAPALVEAAERRRAARGGRP